MIAQAGTTFISRGLHPSRNPRKPDSFPIARQMSGMEWAWDKSEPSNTCCRVFITSNGSFTRVRKRDGKQEGCIVGCTGRPLTLCLDKSFARWHL